VVKSLQGGTTTVSIFAGSSVIAEYDNGAAPGSPSREYIYNPAGGSTTGLLAMISGGATTYYHQDHLSVRLTTDANGNILSQEGHYPFGEAWYESGSGNKWFFTSYDRDSETGLDYALARYYNSRTGTFCSADPLAGHPDDPQSWNRYPYGRNDPIDITDPSGQGWLSWLLDIGIGAAVGWIAPEVLPSVFAWGGTTSTVFYEGAQIAQSSATFYAASAGTAAFGAGVGAEAKAATQPLGPQMPPTPTPTPASQNPQQTPKKNCPPKFANFFKQAPIFNDLAKQLNTKALFLMAQSSWETGWLGPHAQDLHMMFGMTNAGKNDLSYSSFQASANAYSKAYSPYVSNTSTMDQFTAGLKNVPPHGYNTANSNYYKNITDQQQYVKQHAADCGVTVN